MAKDEKKKIVLEEESKDPIGKQWAVRIKILLITTVLIGICNTMFCWRQNIRPVPAPWDIWKGQLILLGICLVSYLIYDLTHKFLPMIPAVLWICTITAVLSFPFCGSFADMMVSELDKIQFSALCTPVLAYAGISIGKDMETFKKQGLSIVVITLLAFVGTWIGSALVAQIVLKLTGQI